MSSDTVHVDEITKHRPHAISFCDELAIRTSIDAIADGVVDISHRFEVC